MVCRTTSIGSAVTSHARLATGLEDQQCLSLFHDLLREGSNAEEPLDVHRDEFFTSNEIAVRNNARLTEFRRQSILTRLVQARTQTVDARTFYAADRMLFRALRAAESLTHYHEAVARTLGITVAEAKTKYHTLREMAAADRTLRAPDDFRAQIARGDHPHLPMDRSSAYAVAALEAERNQIVTSLPKEPVVAARETVESAAVREIGYDPDSGHVEVVLASNPDRVYGYRMDPDDYAEWRDAASFGSYYARRIRGNPDFQYTSAEEAEIAGYRYQCRTCGQFAARTHHCPVYGSSPATDAIPADALVHNYGWGAAAHELHGHEITLASAPLGELRSRTRTNPDGVFTYLNTNQIPQPDGSLATRGSTFGGVRITRAPEGTYRVDPAAMKGHPALRCNCPDYRANYSCEHVTATLAVFADTLNNTPQLSPDNPDLTSAVEEVAADLVQDRAESVAAQHTAIKRWDDTPEQISYLDDPETFQEDYRAAKARRDRGEPPVPYLTDNATGGLGAPDTGRAFGIELEFDFPDDMNWAEQEAALEAIGRDLRDAGLTRHADQRYYHSARADGYSSTHQGGWSFESDDTVAGEIVSPIMHDTPETWENLAKVCEIVQRHGGIASTSAGSHVHVSAHNYNHTVGNHNRLMGLFAENEDLIYRLSANTDRGTHRGRQWCSPNTVPATGYATVADARNANNGHHRGINMESVVGAGEDHVEFRTYDSSLDPGTIQAQINLSLALTETAFRDTNYTPGPHSPLGSHHAHNRATFGASRRLIGEDWHNDTAAIRGLADKLFRSRELKAQMAAVYAMTRWPRRRA